MNATFIAGMLLVIGWGAFVVGVRWMRREQWRRGPFVLFWCSTALLGVATFWYGAGSLLTWSQIAITATTGVIASVIVAAVWGTLNSAPRVGPLKAHDVERAETPPVNGWAVPSFSDMLGGGSPWANSPTIAAIEGMEVA